MDDIRPIIGAVLLIFLVLIPVVVKLSEIQDSINFASDMNRAINGDQNAVKDINDSIVADTYSVVYVQFPIEATIAVVSAIISALAAFGIVVIKRR